MGSINSGHAMDLFIKHLASKEVVYIDEFMDEALREEVNPNPYDTSIDSRKYYIYMSLEFFILSYGVGKDPAIQRARMSLDESVEDLEDLRTCLCDLEQDYLEGSAWKLTPSWKDRTNDFKPFDVNL